MPNPGSEASNSSVRVAGDGADAFFFPFGTASSSSCSSRFAPPVNASHPNLVLRDSPYAQTGDVVIRDPEDGTCLPTSELVIGRELAVGRARVVSVRRKITLAEAVQLGERYMREREAARDRANLRELERVLD